MPELPEVETIVRRLRPRLVGRMLTDVESSWPRQMRPDLDTVRRGLRGQRVKALDRLGKYLIFQLDSGYLSIHLRMSGRLEWASEREGRADHVRAVFRFAKGEALLFSDARKFGRIEYLNDLGELESRLGLDPLGAAFTERALAARLKSHARQLKPLLLDQSVVAGLGNIYTDESLFRAGLHPLRRSNTLEFHEVRKLHRSIGAVLRRAIRENGTSIDWIYPGGGMQEYLRVYGREGESCFRCGGAIQRLVVGQRGTHVCPNCQPEFQPSERCRAKS